MKRTAAILSIILLTAASCSHDITRESFLNPEATWRSIPFWSLNDSLSAEGITTQLELIKEGGQGGAFLHSRIGLLTPYLSDEWFELMGSGVDKCDDLGIEAWFYDEDKWPSGFAGGIVPLADQAFRSRQLARVSADAQVDPEDTVLWQDDNHKYICHVAKLGMPGYNGTCWVDLMNPDMVRFFLECSYRPYIEKFGGRKSVKGIFTDEPQVKATRTPCKGADAQIPYSPWMEQKFKELWGYEMDPGLPSLTDTVGNWRQFRLHYFRTVAACLEDAFSRQVGEYCADNGFIWTGHYNGENTPSANVEHEGNLMQQLRHMQQPGCDALGLQLQTIHNAKVATSVANQYGRRRSLVEVFGISGHNMSFEDRMWISGWHTICGINLMCPHLSLYSMKGERKRDYPPTLSFQQPYWSSNTIFEDYAARLCKFAGTGEPAGEICIVSPLESDFIVRTFVKTRTPDPSYDKRFESAMGALASAHYNFDIADEQIMSEDASVRDGRFIIGQMSYGAVVVPPMLTIRPSTVALLDRFAAEGGKVLVLDSYPEFVEGSEDADAMETLKRASVLIPSGELSTALEQSCPRAFKLRGEGLEQVYTHLRKVDGGYAVQLFNSSRICGAHFTMDCGKARHMAMMDPANGKMLKLVPGADGCVTLDLPAARSIVVFWGTRGSLTGPKDAAYTPAAATEPVCSLQGEWTGHRLDANALPLDFAQFSTDRGRSWSEKEPVIAYYKRSAREAQYDGPLQLRYSFEVGDMPAVCSLAVEQPHIYSRISVNGTPLSSSWKEWYCDPVIRMTDIAVLLKAGTNTVEMSLEYRSPRPAARTALERYGTEIETIYLVGDFAVQAEPAMEQPVTTWRNLAALLQPKPLPLRLVDGSERIVKETASVSGDLVKNGYPFFAGRYELSSNFVFSSPEPECRYLLSFPAVETILVDVEINGTPLPTIFASPWETDVTGLLKPGANEVKLVLTGSLRNLMGPHHHAGGELNRVGPECFTGEDGWLNENAYGYQNGEDNWYELRKSGSSTLWRDDRCCVPFGLLEAPVLLKTK